MSLDNFLSSPLWVTCNYSAHLYTQYIDDNHWIQLISSSAYRGEHYYMGLRANINKQGTYVSYVTLFDKPPIELYGNTVPPFWLDRALRLAERLEEKCGKQ